jgi:hypothetical protein
LLSLGFVVVKQGETEPTDESIHTQPFTRSVNTELDLEAGIYFVYVRARRLISETTFKLTLLVAYQIKIEHSQMMPIEDDDDDDSDSDSEDDCPSDVREVDSYCVFFPAH